LHFFTFCGIIYKTNDKGGNAMDKTKKILMGIVVILVIFSIIITALYFNLRKYSKYTLQSLLDASEETYELNNRVNDLEDEISDLKNQLENK
jgi:CHASE3 domain sensor protein